MIFDYCQKNRRLVALRQHTNRLLLIVLSLFSSPAIALDCSTLPPSQVSIKRLASPITENLQYSYKILKGLGDSYTRPDIEVLGLTRGLAIARFDIKSTTLSTPNQQWECASIALNVEYGFSPITVYVGNEFPKGSCAHNEILQHEMLHVGAYNEHAKKIEQEIGETLRQRFERPTPWRNAAGRTTANLQIEINERWIPYLKRMLDKVNIEQRRIDRPEEYARIAASCDGAIKKAMAENR